MADITCECKYCGGTFVTDKLGTKYCSRDCSRRGLKDAEFSHCSRESLEKYFMENSIYE